MNVAEYELPEPLKALTVPPITEMSPITKLVATSLNVAVIVEVWPLLNDERVLDNVMVGA